MEKDPFKTTARDHSPCPDFAAPRSSSHSRRDTRHAHHRDRQGRLWLEELTNGNVDDVKQIAERESCSVQQVNRTITLAILAPTLVQAALEGRLPRGIGGASLRDLPAEWIRQHEKLGLAC